MTKKIDLDENGEIFIAFKIEGICEKVVVRRNIKNAKFTKTVTFSEEIEVNQNFFVLHCENIKKVKVQNDFIDLTKFN